MARRRVTDRDLGWDNIKRELRRLGNMGVKVGIVEGSGKEKKRVHAVTKSGKKGKRKMLQEIETDVAQVAAWLEEGTETIPSRPFIRSWVDNNQEQINQRLGAVSRSVLTGSRTAEEAARLVGEFAQSGIRRNIVAGSFEPDKPSTVKKKGSSKPLIDTGTLRNSIRYEVVER